ncbi:hypothetical protein GCM10011611_24000 [Aliidongia dinghuensis]|uniref:CAAX prenyl protease 2/Lysostaphin resistance protein A-like domain-containing protein n=1 Tax=Aliidongia dinghuensis TaxID=1867774 RepID=A0A8J3E223_9PROT|nr:hypothetical protein GCM10011611_24000 [Aliidongia dinghuensis]
MPILPAPPDETTPVPIERISLPRLLVYLLAATVLVVTCGGLVIGADRLLFGSSAAPDSIWLWLTYAALALAVLAAYGLHGRFVERRPRRELALRPALRETATGTAIGIGFVALLVLVLAAAGGYRIAGWRSPVEMAMPSLMAIGAALMEEVLARGFVLGLLERWAGSWVALVLSAVLFGAAHLDNPGAGAWPITALTLGAGLALGAAYLATRRLWLPIGLHFGWNFGQSALFGLLDSGTSFPSLIDARVEGPAWLTGGAFGPEASLPGFVLWLLFGLFLLTRAVGAGRLLPRRRAPAVEVPC